MKSRVSQLSVPAPSPAVPALPLKLASWLLDSPRLGQTHGAKRLAGHLLKQPARRGVVEAQSRLGQLLCRHCGCQRDRRIGRQLLQQAARAGDPRAQLELGRQLTAQPEEADVQARYWLEQAAAQGSHEASRLLRERFTDA